MNSNGSGQHMLVIVWYSMMWTIDGEFFWSPIKPGHTPGGGDSHTPDRKGALGPSPDL